MMPVHSKVVDCAQKLVQSNDFGFVNAFFDVFFHFLGSLLFLRRAQSLLFVHFVAFLLMSHDISPL